MVAGSASILPWCKVKPQVEQTLLHGINKFLLIYNSIYANVANDICCKTTLPHTHTHIKNKTNKQKEPKWQKAHTQKKTKKQKTNTNKQTKQNNKAKAERFSSCFHYFSVY